MIKSLAAGAALAVLCAAGEARAGEVFAGAFAHAADINVGAGTEEGGTDLQVGVRSDTMRGWKAIGRPRLYAMGTVNLNGQTSYISGGLLWRHDFGRVVYGQLGFGGAIHNGYVRDREVVDHPDRVALGTRLLF